MFNVSRETFEANADPANIVPFGGGKKKVLGETGEIGTVRYLIKDGAVMGADETEDFLRKKEETERRNRERL